MFSANLTTKQASSAEVRSPSGRLLGLKQRLFGSDRGGSQTPPARFDNVGFSTVEIAEAIGQQQTTPTTQQNSRLGRRSLSLPTAHRQPAHYVHQNKTPKNTKDDSAPHGTRHDATTGDDEAKGDRTVPLLRSERDPIVDSIPPLSAQNDQRHNQTETGANGSTTDFS